MEQPSGRFQASRGAEQVVRRFGAAGPGIRVQMRDCDDVQRYIRKMTDAHNQTAGSTLRFGPSTPQSR